MTYGQSLVVHKQLSSFDGWLVIFILKEKRSTRIKLHYANML